MINVLLNYYNFHEDWARPHLQSIVTGKSVLVLPLAFRVAQAWDNDSWQSIYGKGGEKYDNILAPFLAYGYSEDQIQWLNCFDKTVDHRQQIANADLLFFTGGMPEKAIKWLNLLGLTDAVVSFKGVIMGASAGAMLQLERYHITPDEDYPAYGLWRGLGLVKGLDLEVHYLDTPLQNSCAQRASNEQNLPIYKMWHQGGLIVDGDNITVMGDVQKVLPQ